MFLKRGQYPSDFVQGYWNGNAELFVLWNQLMGVNSDSSWAGNTPITRDQFASALYAYDKYMTNKLSQQVLAQAPNPISGVIDKTVAFIIQGNPPQTVGFEFGAGVIIENGKILTANHVFLDWITNQLVDVSRIEVHLNDGTVLKNDGTWKVTQHKDSQGNLISDLAVLTGNNIQGTHMDSTDAVLGEDCWAIGSPDNHQFSVVKGNVESLVDPVNGEGNTYLVSMPAREGNSGGGLFNADGKLIGIVVAGQTDKLATGSGIRNVYNEKTLVLPIDWRG